MKTKISEILGYYSMILPPRKEIQQYLDIELDEDEICQCFALALKTLRGITKESLNSLSKAVDIPNPSISRYENGLVVPTVPQIIKLIAHFKIPCELFMFCGILKKQGMDVTQIYSDFVTTIEQSKKQNRAQRRAKGKH